MDPEVQMRKRDRARDVIVPRRKKEIPPTPAEEQRRARECAEAIASWEKSRAEDKNKPRLDLFALEAAEFRECWMKLWSQHLGNFEDTTKIPPMRFTDNPAPPYTAFRYRTLQIFSVKVAGLRGGLEWPLHVFGTVALRDSVDRRRNIIFNRERDSCQTLTQKNPCLALTGPSRAVVMVSPVTFEVELRVKGTTESEDKDLSYLAVQLVGTTSVHPCLLVSDYTSKLSTVEFTHGQLSYSVEATISVQVTDGSWNGYRSKIFACTASIADEVLLLDSGDEEVPVTVDGNIKLSRQVVSVEHKGKLIVCLKAWQGDNLVDLKVRKFTPKEFGRSHRKLNVSFCNMKVTVAWSLVTVEYKL